MAAAASAFGVIRGQTYCTALCTRGTCSISREHNTLLRQMPRKDILHVECICRHSSSLPRMSGVAAPPFPVFSVITSEGGFCGHSLRRHLSLRRHQRQRPPHKRTLAASPLHHHTQAARYHPSWERAHALDILGTAPYTSPSPSRTPELAPDEIEALGRAARTPATLSVSAPIEATRVA